MVARYKNDQSSPAVREVQTGVAWIENINGPSQICNGRFSMEGYYEVPAIKGALNYVWSVPNGNSGVKLVQGGGNTCNFSSVNPRNYELKVTVENNCGFSSYSINVYVANCDEYEPYLVSPNPASDHIMIEENYEDNIEASSVDMKKADMRMYNQQGKMVRQKELKEKKERIDVSNLKEGTYFLHIILQDRVLKQQIIIKR